MVRFYRTHRHICSTNKFKHVKLALALHINLGRSNQASFWDYLAEKDSHIAFTEQQVKKNTLKNVSVNKNKISHLLTYNSQHFPHYIY
jgi:hypothetical protein